MGNYTREEILQMAEEEDVEFIRLQFTDMFGTLKNIAITAPWQHGGNLKSVCNFCRQVLCAVNGNICFSAQK